MTREAITRKATTRDAKQPATMQPAEKRSAALKSPARTRSAKRGNSFLMLTFLLLIMVTFAVQNLLRSELSARRNDRDLDRIEMMQAAIESAAASISPESISEDLNLYFPIEYAASTEGVLARVSVTIETVESIKPVSDSPSQNQSQKQWQATLELKSKETDSFKPIDTLRRPLSMSTSS